MKKLLIGICVAVMLCSITVTAQEYSRLSQKIREISTAAATADSTEKLAGEGLFIIIENNLFERLADIGDFNKAEELKKCADAAIEASSGKDINAARQKTQELCSCLQSVFTLLGGGAEQSLFDDVAFNAWYYDAVSYTVSNGIFKGMGNNRFAPDDAITRGMFLTLMGRIYMENEEVFYPGYTDVTEGEYYADAVNWAKANGILTFIEGDMFYPDKPISREELVTVLRGCIAYGKADTGFETSADFADIEEVSDWAKTAVSWAAEKNIVSGFEDKTFRPKDTASRAQVAQILFNLSKRR